MTRSSLEAQLEDATREFVGKILTILRSASLADVAAAQAGPARGPYPSGVPAPRASRTNVSGDKPEPIRRRRPSTGAGSDLDLIPQIVDALTAHGGPVPARTIADRLGVPLDRLAKPLKQLRDERRIEKQGDKRATKYVML